MKRPTSFLKRCLEHKVEILVLSGALLALAITCLVLSLSPKASATEAKVFLKGEELYSLTLSEDRVLYVDVEDGRMEVTVKNGAIAVTSSPCPSQYCVLQGYQSKAGNSILCAHSGLAIYLYGETDIEEVIV